MSLVRVSAFCRRDTVIHHDVRLEVGTSSFSSTSDCSTSSKWLRHASWMSGTIVWIQTPQGRQVAIRLMVDLKSIENDDEFVIVVSPLVAANLGIDDPNDNHHHHHHHTESCTQAKVFLCEESSVAETIALRCWARPFVPNTPSVLGPSPTNSEPKFPLPGVGSLLQTGTLTAVVDVPTDGTVYFYEVLAVGDNKQSVAVTSPTTRYNLESPPLGTWAPRLPKIRSNDVDVRVPHPDVPILTISLQPHRLQQASDCIWLYLGTVNQHDIQVAVSETAAQLGRRFVSVACGLATYAYLQGSVVNTGGLADKLKGLSLAVELAQRHAPSVLHLVLNSDLSHDTQERQDQESRFWTLLTTKLNITTSDTASQGCPKCEPPVLVVLSLQTLRAGPIAEHMVHDSIKASLPDTKYMEYLWSEVLSMPMMNLLKGRPVHEVRQLQRDYAKATMGSFGDSVETLEMCCSRRDTERRHKSGLERVPQVHWEDIGGLDHVRRQIMDAIELPLQFPNLDTTNGILFYGPPGCGKTLTARAIATECKLPFLSVKGPELLGSYVGESEANVREVFATARKLALQNQPAASVLFFDELDSLAPCRGDHAGGSNVMDRLVATLFAELDRKSEDCAVFCIGATNRPDLLDPALLRPGRLARLVYLGVADSDKVRILETQFRSLRLDDNARAMAEVVAEHVSANLTGADLSVISKQALLRATERVCNAADKDLQERQRIGESATLECVLDEWTDDQLTPVVTLDDLVIAAEHVHSSISAEELARYERLSLQFSRAPPR